MTTVKQDRDFLEKVVGLTVLEAAVEWIGDNLAPEEVFNDRELEAWASAHGWIEE